MLASVEEIRDQFTKKLDEAKQERDMRLAQDLEALRRSFLKHKTIPAARDVRSSIQRLVSAVRPKAGSAKGLFSAPRQAMVNITHSVSLQSLDELFIQQFALDVYYSPAKLTYPTVLCETLEEFFQPFVDDMNISEQARQQELTRWIEEAKQSAEENHGGIFGVNFPGKGCYLNGWLFAALAGIPVNAIKDHPEVMARLLGTAAHEKLGHGFISVYSALGKLKSDLGITLAHIAEQFGFALADDAEAQLRRQQHALLFTISQLLEEGWANWIQKTMQRLIQPESNAENYSVPDVVEAIAQLPDNLEKSALIKESALCALAVIFGEEQFPMEEILQAITILVRIGESLDSHFAPILHQPLRYALGELICLQCEQNLGTNCVPYAILIAANVTFDPHRMSLSDLSALMMNDARLHPDTRLAAISRIKLDNPGDMKELTQKVNAQLSLSIPPELR